MIIGVTHCNGEVFQHFGKSPEIALYLIDEESGVVRKQIATVDNGGHEGIATMLVDLDVDVLLCGGIGQGAIETLYSLGIQVFPGCSGNTDELIKQLLEGHLEQVTGPTCNCHDHEHTEGEEHHCHCHDHEEGEKHEEGHHCHCHDGE